MCACDDCRHRCFSIDGYHFCGRMVYSCHTRPTGDVVHGGVGTCPAALGRQLHRHIYQLNVDGSVGCVGVGTDGGANVALVVGATNVALLPIVHLAQSNGIFECGGV